MPRKIEIGGLIAFAIAAITAAVGYGKLEGRVSSLEREIENPKKQMREEAKTILVVCHA